MRSATREPLALNLVQKSDILVEFDETKEGNELAHNRLLPVGLHSESSLNYCRVQDFHFLLSKLVALVHFDGERILVGVVIKVDESVIEQEARVALLTI